jgi:RNA recognition motif-containing protein
VGVTKTLIKANSLREVAVVEEGEDIKEVDMVIIKREGEDVVAMEEEAVITTIDLHQTTFHTKLTNVSLHTRIMNLIKIYKNIDAEEDSVALKIRGLPYQTRFEEIIDFFKDYNYVEKSVVMGIGQDGRKNGFASILFQSNDDAKKAMDEMQRGHVGSRYVELSVISYGDYLRFNGPVGGGNYVRLSKYVSNDNKEKCVVMRGLPYRITVEEIITFFEGFGNLTEGDIFIEENNGKRTGSALIIFENEDVAQDAKASLNKKCIGEEQRWVELYDCHDQFMQKICNLYN